MSALRIITNQTNAIGLNEWTFKRIFIVASDKLCWLSAVCAITLTETFKYSNNRDGTAASITIINKFDVPQRIISAEEYIACGVCSNPSCAALNSLCGDLKNGAELLKRVFFAVDMTLVNDAPLFVPNFENDLYIYIAAWGDVDCVGHASLRSLISLRESCGFIIIIADDASWHSVCSVVYSGLFRWKGIVCRLPFFAPPSHNLSLAQSFVRRCNKIKGVLELISLGVALGTVKYIPLSFCNSLHVVPLNIAVNTALVVILLERNHRPTLFSPTTNIFKCINFTTDSVLVWGMLAEYLMDYYRRLYPDVKKTFPLPNLLDMDPILQLGATVFDRINYRVAYMMPFCNFYKYKAVQRRNFLISQLNNEVAEEYISMIVENIDEAVKFVTRPEKDDCVSFTFAAQNKEINKHVSEYAQPDILLYSTILQTLTRDVLLQSLLLFVSVKNVQWDIYVKSIAQAAVEHVVWRIFKRPFYLPLPVPLYYNDLVFHGTRRVPSTRFFFREILSGIHWLTKTGMKSNGTRVEVLPGLTKEIQVRILSSQSVLQSINEVAKNENLSNDIVEQRAVIILKTIGDTLNNLQLRILGYIVRSALFALYDEVTLNDSAFERLFRALNTPRVQVVLIPAHRSYVDFIIMTYLMVVMGFSAPHVCAGDDFMRMGPIAKLMRGSGAFFMRRSFRGDKLYLSVFKEYIRQLVLERKLMEFFIEGTRSRLGKTLPPKLGILRFVIDAFCGARNEVDDVYFIPISISYDELLEANLYANEELGASKPKESVGNLIRARSLLKTRHGSIHLHIAESLSLRDFCDDQYHCPAALFEIMKEEKDKTSLQLHVDEPIQLRVAKNLSWHITHNLEKNTIITPTALLATVLNVFASPLVGIKLCDIHTRIGWLRGHIINRSGNDVLSHDCMNKSVEELTHMGIIYLRDFVKVFSDKGVVSISQNDVSYVGIRIYTNQLIHIFIDEAVVALAARVYGDFDGNAKTINVRNFELMVKVCKELSELLSEEFQNHLCFRPYSFTSWFKYAFLRLLEAGKYDSKENIYFLTSGHKTCAVNDVVNNNNNNDSNGETDNKNNNNNIDILSQATAVIPMSKELFGLLSFMLAPFVGSLFVVTLGLCALSISGCEETIHKETFLKACQISSLGSQNTKRLVPPQSCTLSSLRCALVGVARLCGFCSGGGGGIEGARYIIPARFNGVELLARVRRFLQCVGDAHPSFLCISDEEGERRAQDCILREYQRRNTGVTPSSKI